MSHQVGVLDDSLGYEQAIERVFVVSGQAFECENVCQQDGQHRQVIEPARMFNKLGERQIKLQLAQLKLHLHFPNGSDAQQDRV